NTSVKTKEKPFKNTRFVTVVKLNRGLKTSNYDQLYAYLKQHEAHANENKMMLERYTQHGGQANMFDDDVDEELAPTVHTMFMENLSLADPIYDEAGLSYDLDILSKYVKKNTEPVVQTGSESCPPMLKKENYVPWSSRLLCYAKSRPNVKLIHNSIINGPYVRRMIPEPGDKNRVVPVNETFHVQTDDECWVIISINPLNLSTVSFGVDAAMKLEEKH
nr:ribonuclease H-like domain-containing protein [Tanacetum cinerariifolium]